MRPEGPAASTHATCPSPSPMTLDSSSPRCPTPTGRDCACGVVLVASPRQALGAPPPPGRRPGPTVSALARRSAPFERAEPSPRQFEHRRELLGLRSGVGRPSVRTRRPTSALSTASSRSATSATPSTTRPSSAPDEPACGLGHGAQAPGGDLDAERLGHDVLDGVGLVEHDDVVLGQHRAVAGDVGGVEVGVDHDDVGRGGALARLLGEADRSRRTPEGSGTLARRHRHRRPGAGVGLEVELGAIAGGRCLGPGDEPAELATEATDVDRLRERDPRPGPAGLGIVLEQGHARQARPPRRRRLRWRAGDRGSSTGPSSTANWTVRRAASASATSGRSLVASWSWRARVAVATTTDRPDNTAGTR